MWPPPLRYFRMRSRLYPTAGFATPGNQPNVTILQARPISTSPFATNVSFPPGLLRNWFTVAGSGALEAIARTAEMSDRYRR